MTEALLQPDLSSLSTSSTRGVGTCPRICRLIQEGPCRGVLHRGGSTRQFQLSMTGWRSPSGRDSQTASELF